MARFEVVVTRTRTETYTVEAETAADAATGWRGTEPVTVEGPSVSEVHVTKVQAED